MIETLGEDMAPHPDSSLRRFTNEIQHSVLMDEVEITQEVLSSASSGVHRKTQNIAGNMAKTSIKVTTTGQTRDKELTTLRTGVITDNDARSLEKKGKEVFKEALKIKLQNLLIAINSVVL